VGAGSTFDRLPDDFVEFLRSVLLATEMQGEPGQRISRIKFTRTEDESAYFEKQLGNSSRAATRVALITCNRKRRISGIHEF
jgi:hypothetical protein